MQDFPTNYTLEKLILLSQWREKLSIEAFAEIAVRLKQIELDDRKWLILSSSPLKDPNLTLLLSIGYGGFGVDRFYLGQIGKGVAKLLLGLFTFGIWYCVDIFLARRVAYELNFRSLMAAIDAISIGFPG